MFEFISGSLLQYDRMEKNFQNFHLQFLFRYLKFIGLEPLGIDTLFEGDRNGRLYPLIDREVTGRLLNDQYGSDATLSRDQRRILLELLTNFILNNLEIDEPLKSLKVLKEIFE